MKSTDFNIPGLHKIAFKRKLKVDLLFFIVSVALPTSFFNFIPKTIFIDLRLLFLAIGILYIVFNIQRLNKLLKINGIKLLLWMVVFLIFRFMYAIVIQNIPVIEVVTIFRTNYSYPLITFGFLLYASNMDNERLFRFLYWIFLVTLIAGAIYILSNLTGINFYANVSKEYNVFNNTVLMQNMASIPKFSKFLFVFGVLASITLSKFKKIYYILVPFVVTVISIVRSELLVYFALLFFIILFINISRFSVKSTKFFKFVFIGIVSVGIATLIFSSHISRLVNKFGFDESTEISSSRYIEEGTYKVRLNLVEDANKAISNDLLLGNGYKREVKKGEYSYVVGGDTLVAPIIYTEGYLGLLLRCLPIFWFLVFGIKNIKSKHKFTAFISIVMVSIIMAESINIIQTRIFVFYNEILFIFFLLAMINHNYKKEMQISANGVS